MFETQKKENVD